MCVLVKRSEAVLGRIFRIIGHDGETGDVFVALSRSRENEDHGGEDLLACVVVRLQRLVLRFQAKRDQKKRGWYTWHPSKKEGRGRKMGLRQGLVFIDKKTDCVTDGGSNDQPDGATQ